eukprot:4776253-Pyramimonas_sp.AAC.1
MAGAAGTGWAGRYELIIRMGDGAESHVNCTSLGRTNKSGFWRVVESIFPRKESEFLFAVSSIPQFAQSSHQPARNLVCKTHAAATAMSAQ